MKIIPFVSFNCFLPWSAPLTPSSSVGPGSSLAGWQALADKVCECFGDRTVLSPRIWSLSSIRHLSSDLGSWWLLLLARRYYLHLDFGVVSLKNPCTASQVLSTAVEQPAFGGLRPSEKCFSVVTAPGKRLWLVPHRYHFLLCENNWKQ